MQMHNPAHPGEVLKEYIGETEVTTFAGRLGVDRTTLSRLLNGHASISATMALKLEETLGTSAEMWMNMQAVYDLWTARQKAMTTRRYATRSTSVDRPQRSTVARN